VLRQVPPFDPAMWIIILVLYVYIVRTLVKLRRRLHQKDIRANDRVAAV
jgi:hypothetical protein